MKELAQKVDGSFIGGPHHGRKHNHPSFRNETFIDAKSGSRGVYLPVMFNFDGQFDAIFYMFESIPEAEWNDRVMEAVLEARMTLSGER